jgi:hypothetical protein
MCLKPISKIISMAKQEFVIEVDTEKRHTREQVEKIIENFSRQLRYILEGKKIEEEIQLIQRTEQELI